MHIQIAVLQFILRWTRYQKILNFIHQRFVCQTVSNIIKNAKIEFHTSAVMMVESRAKFCITTTKSARGWSGLASSATAFGPLQPFRGRGRGRRGRGLHVHTVISIGEEIVLVCKGRASSTASNDLARGRRGRRTLQTLRLFSHDSFLSGACHSRFSQSEFGLFQFTDRFLGCRRGQFKIEALRLALGLF